MQFSLETLTTTVRQFNCHFDEPFSLTLLDTYANSAVSTGSPAEPAPPVNELQGMQAYGRANEAAPSSLSVYSRSQGVGGAADADTSSAAGQQAEAMSGQRSSESLRVYSSGDAPSAQIQVATPTDDPFARPPHNLPTSSAASVAVPAPPSGGAAEATSMTTMPAYRPGDTVQATLEALLRLELLQAHAKSAPEMVAFTVRTVIDGCAK